LLADRILPFDAAASQTYADILSAARAQGKAISNADGYIAATAKRHGFIVATRDTNPFEAAGITVINPWTAQH
jgi:predicted nucleic acid-binding protein